MNPENDALNRTYFIGGPPRVGKTILSFALADKIRGHVVSTDSIRNAAKKACSDKESDFFIINRTENISEDEWLKNHLEHPEITVEHQNRESRAIWPSLVSFCNSFCEDDAVHILEGVALLPSLVYEMKNRPANVFFVGNTNTEHVKAMNEHAVNFPDKDWMIALNYSSKKIEGMANFVKAMSFYFKSQAEKYGFPYFEISDDDFAGSIAEIVDKMSARDASSPHARI
jgi:2-phosphoglycerate kinase